MNLLDIENNIKRLLQTFNQDTFIYDLLLAYNLPKATVTRLQKGTANISKVPGEVSLKKKVFFKEIFNRDLHLGITELLENVKNDQRFLIVTDYRTLLAKDLKLNTTLDIKLVDLGKHYDFLLPLAGMEKAQLQNENPADIKAATKMAKLYDELRKDNPDDSEEFLKSLNVFLTRLLFCFFAEDSDIFEDNQFTNAIASHTNQDGSDLNEYLDSLFKVLNTPNTEREQDIPKYLNDFPYVNGGLFSTSSVAPRFSRTTRNLIIESGSLDWAEINPDIFGSMFQAVNHADTRGSLGQHFTSVPNIMKVIGPLFLDNLYEEFERANGDRAKLNKLLYRLKNIIIFDPACGSGNFLIIAYKELRRLEMKIFRELGSLALSEISLNQFYGIELDDFAHEVAILALWLTKHQMNVEFFKEFGRTNPTLPLTDSGNITHGNSALLDWQKVCSAGIHHEVFIVGNPPYLGSTMQNPQQKKEMEINLSHFGSFKNLDYISIWFYKASQFIKIKRASFAFVSTNSICQGEQVNLLWNKLLTDEIEITFAHQSFKWTNNAIGNAGVTVVIIGMSSVSKREKFIYTQHGKKSVHYINAYLTDGNKTIIKKRSTPLSLFPQLENGNKAVDGGNLIIQNERELKELESNHPNSRKYVRKLIGSKEFIQGTQRWCLWIPDNEVDSALEYEMIRNRVELTRINRLNSRDKGANKLANKPYRFRDNRTASVNSIFIPSVSSEKRTYLPVGFQDSSSIIVAPNFFIADPETYLFSILSSRMHMIWIKATSGKLESRIRYSSALVYNTFPFPHIGRQRKEELSQSALKIINLRFSHSEKTIAELYDPDKMPKDLKKAHYDNDLAIERCYRTSPFKSDEERSECLFKLYEKMVDEEKSANTLFAKQKKSRKRK